MSRARFDGTTGRPLVKLTPEELHEHVQRTIEADQQWLRDQADRARQLADATRAFIYLEFGYDIWGTEAQLRFDALRQAVEAYETAKTREDEPGNEVTG